jgi:biopolymer transport protein ExbD
MIKNHDDNNERSHGDMPFLVPLLDLTMILLFFFVIMSNVAQNVFDIKLPNKDKTYNQAYIPLDKDEPIKIFIKIDNLGVNDQIFSDIESFKQNILQLIQQELQNGKQISEIKITVSSDKNVDVQKFLQIMTFLKSQGLEKVDILMGTEPN